MENHKKDIEDAIDHRNVSTQHHLKEFSKSALALIIYFKDLTATSLNHATDNES